MPEVNFHDRLAVVLFRIVMELITLQAKALKDKVKNYAR